MKRSLALAGLGASVVALGTFGAVAWAYDGDPNDHKVAICHASASAENPYQMPSVDKDSIQNTDGLVANGHGTHVGPIFDPETNQSGDNWGDVIPPFTAGYLAGPPEKEWGAFPGVNWTAEGQAIWENGCSVPEPPGDVDVTPTAPTFQDPTCDVGADVILPNVTGVTYAIEGTVAPGETVTVEATAEEGYVLVGTDEWTHTFGNVPDNCGPPPEPPIEVTPGVVFQDPTCDVGAAVVPTTTTGLTYAIEGEVAPGEKVAVTASANDGYTISGNNQWEHTFGLIPSNCEPTTTEPTPAVPTPTAPLTPPTTPTTPTKPTKPTTPTKPAATKPPAKKAPKTEPAPLTPPRKVVAGAREKAVAGTEAEQPELAYTP